MESAACTGSLAELAAVDARLIAHKPKALSMEQTAALPLGFITSWEGLVDRAGVAAGHQVLIHGGAGGVGFLAVQLALARGAQVFATGGPSSQEVIRQVGATPIDYTTSTVDEYVDEHTGGEGFDIVVDNVGGATLDASFTAVKRYTGHVVSALGWGTHSLAPLSFRGATYSGVFTLMPLLTGRGREHHGHIVARPPHWPTRCGWSPGCTRRPSRSTRSTMPTRSSRMAPPQAKWWCCRTSSRISTTRPRSSSTRLSPHPVCISAATGNSGGTVCRKAPELIHRTD